MESELKICDHFGQDGLKIFGGEPIEVANVEQIFIRKTDILGGAIDVGDSNLLFCIFFKAGSGFRFPPFFAIVLIIPIIVFVVSLHDF